MAVPRKFTTLVGIACIAGIATCLIVFLISRGPSRQRNIPQETPEATDDPTMPTIAAAKTPTPSPAKSDVRRRVRAIVDKDSQSVAQTSLPRYLDELLSRARSQGQITALEADVGVEMIRRLGGDMEMQIAFTNRLNQLAQELNHEPLRPTPVQAATEVSALGDKIASETAPDKREALIADYVEKLRFLEPEQQTEAATRLNQMVHATPPAQPAELSMTSMTERWAAVERTQGQQRQAAINDLVEAIRQLPPEQQVQQAQRLNALTGQPNSQTP